MADGGRIFGEIDRAFRQEGFERDWAAANKVRYCGKLKCNNTVVSLTVDVPDFDFIRSPDIRVENLQDLPSKVLPHVFGSDGSLCYIQRTVTILDRYDPGGTILFCLKAAKQTLEDAISGRTEQDIAAEFFVYWGGMAYVDLPNSFKGTSAVETWVAMSEDAPTLRTLIVTEKGILPVALQRHHNKLAQKTQIITTPCSILHIPIVLTVGRDKDRWPPSTLADLLLWLGGHATQFSNSLAAAILAGGRSWLTVLRALNGDFLVQIKLPPIFDTREFTETRRAKLPDLLLKQRPQEVAIERYTGWPISSDYIYGRNLEGMTNLANKKIMLIGCGTIGSLLAHQMAQSGAGTGERGELQLVDGELLSSGNLGRHLLGITFIGVNKATGCQKYLLDNLPHANVTAMPVNAMELRSTMTKYDLIIDATGEDAFSIALNQHAIDAAPKFPPVIYTWLLGNGAATQSFYCDGDQHACFKCLKPVMNEPPRYDMLKGETKFGRILACGDSGYIPFPVSRSAQAASLALEMILAWAREDVRHRLQGRVLDAEYAKAMKDTNPDKSPKCPACRAS